MENKKAAMEMSVGTIVTIVLLMTVLVLGLVLVRTIFTGSQRVADMTFNQLENEVKGLFSEESRLVIIPSSKELQIKPGEKEAFGVGIKNLGGLEDDEFSYEVTAAEIGNDCKDKVRLNQVEEWIIVGVREKDINIPEGEFVARRVSIGLPIGAPLCTIRYKIEVNEGRYAADFIDIILVP